MAGDVTSLSISGCMAADESNPFVITIPTGAPGGIIDPMLALCNVSNAAACSFPN
eukprot:COSAG06_NODE_58169_length_278_cov_0.564246_1_plen_54_part_01